MINNFSNLTQVFAYIGPGMCGGIIAAIFGIVAAFFLGLWGILYYSEIRKGNAIVWGFFACLTMIFMILLGLEKAE